MNKPTHHHHLQTINMVVVRRDEQHSNAPSSLELSFGHCLWRIFSEPKNDHADEARLIALQKDLEMARANPANNVALLDEKDNNDDNVDLQTAELAKTWESLKRLNKSLDMPVSMFSSSSSTTDPTEIVGTMLTNTAKSLAASYVVDENSRQAARERLESEIEEYQKELEEALTVAFPPPRKKQRRGTTTVHNATTPIVEDETPTKSFLEDSGGGDDESNDVVLMQRVQDILEKQQQANTKKYRLALLPSRCSLSS